VVETETAMKLLGCNTKQDKIDKDTLSLSGVDTVPVLKSMAQDSEGVRWVPARGSEEERA
jgi:hypothetical protein